MVYFKSQHITEQKMLFMMVGEGETNTLSMFKSEPVDKTTGIFLCYYVDRHVNITGKSSYHAGLNPSFISRHNTLQNKRCFL